MLYKRLRDVCHQIFVLKNSKKSEQQLVFIAEATALIAVMETNKKGKKKMKIEQEEEAEVLEPETLLTTTSHALTPKLKNPRKNRIGKLNFALKAKSGMVKKHKSKPKPDSANKDEAHALLAGCVVHRFAGCPALSLFGK